MYKFYDLESMTQEDLNGLALERNILQEENNRLNDGIKKIKKDTNFIKRQIKGLIILFTLFTILSIIWFCLIIICVY